MEEEGLKCVGNIPKRRAHQITVFCIEGKPEKFLRFMNRKRRLRGAYTKWLITFEYFDLILFTRKINNTIKKTYVEEYVRGKGTCESVLITRLSVDPELTTLNDPRSYLICTANILLIISE